MTYRDELKLRMKPFSEKAERFRLAVVAMVDREYLLFDNEYKHNRTVLVTTSELFFLLERLDSTVMKFLTNRH